MLTGETITDADILKLGHAYVALGFYTRAMWCDFALIPESNPSRFDIPKGCDRKTARAMCAKFANALAASSDVSAA